MPNHDLNTGEGRAHTASDVLASLSQGVGAIATDADATYNDAEVTLLVGAIAVVMHTASMELERLADRRAIDALTTDGLFPDVADDGQDW